jgi:hypothetical protein
MNGFGSHEIIINTQPIINVILIFFFYNDNENI